jgi:hypothetical protein
MMLNQDQITMMQDLLEQLHLQNKQTISNLDDLHNKSQGLQDVLLDLEKLKIS